MEAIVLFGKNDVRYVPNYTEPHVVNPDDVKLRVHYTGICGSDLKEVTSGPIFFRNGGHPISGGEMPMVLGHEISAEVIDVGTAVKDFVPGDMVVVEVTGTCHDQHRFPDGELAGEPMCGACVTGHYNACEHLALTGLGFQDGGLAEYMVTSSSKLVKYDKKIIPADVAAVVQPIAVAWHAVRVSRFESNHSVVILGGGPIGLTLILALRGRGCTHIVVSEPAERRRKLAERLGAITFDPTDKNVTQCVSGLRALSRGGTGAFDRSFDCSGVASTFETGIQVLGVRGVATNVAMWGGKGTVPFAPMAVTLAEKYVTGSICFVRSDFEETVAALESGAISVEDVRLLVTSRVALCDGVEHGLNELLHRKAHHVKILFHPSSRTHHSS